VRRNFRFAIISDPHVALPHTIWDHPKRFHLVEVAIPALDQIFAHLASLDLDFLLIPGDLVQHGERDNHTWLGQRLAQLPYPSFVIPGNHDIPYAIATETAIAPDEFPSFYRASGYRDTDRLYYTAEPVPGLHLIALNSNIFDADGIQQGAIDDAQLSWLEIELEKRRGDRIFAMVHHNTIEHVPQQSRTEMGRRYMLDNAIALQKMLETAGVPVVFTGHLHIQDIAATDRLLDITTGSLVSYPHPYRILEYDTDRHGQAWLNIASHRIERAHHWDDLGQFSREWMGDRSRPFMLRLLMDAPLNLSLEAAETLLPALRYFWADIAQGDTQFDFAHFPPQAQRFFEAFSARTFDRVPSFIDNHATLKLG
jgi:3',5'-cyclic AMP phosphodiesterase CpdA